MEDQFSIKVFNAKFSYLQKIWENILTGEMFHISEEIQEKNKNFVLSIKRNQQDLRICWVFFIF